MKLNMRLIPLLTLISLFCCSGSTLAQIQPDSTGTKIIIGKNLFRQVVQKLNERNYFQAENTNLSRELEIEQIMNEYKERQISLLKSELVKALNNPNCPEPRPGYDRFFWGFVGVLVVEAVALITALLIIK